MGNHTDIDTPPEGYTEHDWADLSKEEREGIIDGLNNPEGEEGSSGEEVDPETLAKLAKEGEGEETEEEKAAREKADAEEQERREKAEQKARDEATAAATGKTIEQVVADREAKEKAEDEPGKEPPPAEPRKETPPAKPGEDPPKGQTEDPARVPDEELLRFRAVVPDSELVVEEKVSPEIQKKLDELDEKYDAGEVDLKTYNKDRDSLNRQVVMESIQARDALRTQKTWEKEQSAFFAVRPEYLEKGEDGKFTEKAEMLYGAFERVIKRIGSDPRYANAPGMELLITADKAVKKTLGIGTPADPPKGGREPGKDKGKGDGEAGGGKPPAKAPGHVTLSEVPAAAAASTDSPWSALDNLQGAAYEEALERLTPEQRERYLSSR